MGGKAHEFREPGKDLMLNECGSLIEAGHVRIEGGGQHVGHHGERRAGALDPTPEARVEIAVGIGADALKELLVNVGRIGRLERDRLVEGGADGIGHGLPGRLSTERSEMVECVVDHAMGKGAESGPVGRVERFLDGGSRRPGWRSHRWILGSEAGTFLSGLWQQSAKASARGVAGRIEIWHRDGNHVREPDRETAAHV